MLRRRRVTTPLFETNNNDVNPSSPIDLPDDRPTPEQAFAEKESRAVVAHAISRLRTNLRTVALLRELQGLSNAAEADSESVEELAEEGQAFEAEAIDGVENAPDPDVAEVTTREVLEDDVPEEYDENEK